MGRKATMPPRSRPAPEGQSPGRPNLSRVDGFKINRVTYEWTGWSDLDTALVESVLPSEAGLYRIRRVGADGLDYIGQTGVGISVRVRMLRGITRDVMPYRD